MEAQHVAKMTLFTARPSFLLFRADFSENIDGCRWLLLAWLPDAVPEVERVRRQQPGRAEENMAISRAFIINRI